MAKFTNYSFKTNGTNQYLIVPADGTSSGPYGSGNAKVFTISFWFLNKETGWAKGLFKWANTSTPAADPYLSLGTYNYTPPGLLLRTNGADLSSGAMGSSFAFDVWNHIAITRAAGATGATTVYLNGTSIGVSTGPGTANEAEATHLLFAFPWYNTTLYGHDLLTDMAIWDVELDLATIQSIYNTGTPNDLTLAASYTTGSGVDQSGNLQGYWRPDNATFTGVGPQWEMSDEGLLSNTMDSVLMDVFNRAGGAPNSSYNGSTINMGVGDRATPGAS